MKSLTDLLSNLSHLNLEGLIVDKQMHASGYGSSCDVFSAWSTKHGKKVAVKQIRMFLRKDEVLLKRLSREIGIWATLSHPNILPFLGFVVEGENLIPNLVSEWMLRGTLHDYMQLIPRCGEETCTLLYGIASGLSYLHIRGIIHADLKSHNVLISATRLPLLADFGLSLALSQSQSAMSGTASCVKGTIPWMARELFLSPPDGRTLKHTAMSDIWAFGMVAYELLSWEVPYGKKRPEPFVMLSIMNGELPERPEQHGDPLIFYKLWALCNSCWLDASSRPTGYQIMAHLAFINSKVHSHYTAFLDQMAMRCRKVDGSLCEAQVPAAVASERNAIHSSLSNWSPTVTSLDKANASKLSEPSSGVSLPIVMETDIIAAPAIHDLIHHEVESEASSLEHSEFPFLKGDRSEPANKYVETVISDLFSWPWSSSLTDEDEDDLYDFRMIIARSNSSSS
ncbi:kinase-like protein [Schizopora paradoxa]|uniref:Kinase-like protein n=1 Tax=Schizopora paradoxa TaxID=27342 RepID=A0A0H2RKT8_9AGAM|nr:kinase-like protein [Schizopora paradoxa]